MSSIFDSLGATVKSIGGAARGVFELTPLGVAWDLATMALDDKDDNFGTLVEEMAGSGADALDPILNSQTVTGYGFGKVMQGIEWTWREGISEPVATVNTMGGHVAYDVPENWADIFSGEKWGEAYDVAQNRSIGQSAMLAQMQYMTAGLAPGLDPLDKRAYKQAHKEAPFLTTLHSGTTDFAARWFLDPGIVIGKAGKTVRAAQKMRKITPGDMPDGMLRPDAFEAVHGVKPFGWFRKDPLGSRTEDYLNFINRGANGKPLSGAQVYYASPELARSPRGRQVAGLLADTNRIEDGVLRDTAQRRILSVAWGDQRALEQVRDELAEMGAIGDALTNIAKGTTLDLKTHALGQQVLGNPELLARLNGQLDNLSEDVAKVVDQHVTKLNALIDTEHSLRFAPGVHASGKRALARNEGRGLLRSGEAASGHRLFDEPVNFALERAKRLGQHPTLTSVFQYSESHVPLRIVTHTAANVAKYGLWSYVKMPIKISDAMRTSHLQSFVNVHDWDGAANQLDSMLKLGAVDAGQRLTILSRVHMARTESEKLAVIQQVEKEAALGLVAKHGVQKGFGSKKELQGFINDVMAQGHAKRSAHLAAFYGRAYSATKNQLDEGRVDQITHVGSRANLLDDDGVPVALPLLETQLQNLVPLFDAELFDTMLKRQYGRLATLAKAWAKADQEIGAMKRLQGSTGKAMRSGLDKSYAAKDELVRAGQMLMRGWKFSVLFRLGYPLRVVADDHMRIWSQVGGMAVLAPLLRETSGNVWYNHGRWLGDTRYRALTDQLNTDRARLAQVNDSLTPGQVAAFEDRKAQLIHLNRSIAAGRWSLRRAEEGQSATPERAEELRERLARLERERDVVHALLGDDTDALLREKRQLEEWLDLGRGEQKKMVRKHRIGERDIVMPDGTRYKGALAGDVGDAHRIAASSSGTWDNMAKVGEERSIAHQSGQGQWRVINNDDLGQPVAWADALNNQFRQSQVAMWFIKHEDTDDPAALMDEFAAWVKAPEQAELRRRLPHFAHDAEDWGWRVKQMVDDYLPTTELRDMVRKGRVTSRQLDRMFQDVSQRPAVHGATVLHNIGEHSRHQLGVGQTINRLYRYIGELPTDTLARQPFFNVLYKSEVTRLHAQKVAYTNATGKVFGQADVDGIERLARRNALGELKRTLFDISAHSNAAHFMRFISPFFAAHQEALARWWRIVADDPSIIRRFQQGFDIPRHLGLVVDRETGEPVKVGAMPGPNHSIMLQVPEAFGGSDTALGEWFNNKFAGWRINENSLNIVLQNGLFNPGQGPILQVPTELVVQKFARLEELERLGRLFNPYPPESIGQMVMPATVRRLHTIFAKDSSNEYARMFKINLDDKIVDWKMAHGDGSREPTQREMARIVEDAKNETNTEAWLRFFQNALSPAPASPRSKYEVFRQGWRKIMDQMRAEQRDYDWAIEQFKSKYGKALLPMISSVANNPGNVSATHEALGVLQKNRRLIDKVNIRFAGAIVGPAGAYSGPEDYSDTVARWLRDNVHRDSEDTFYSYDNPLTAVREAAAKRGWNRYGRIVDSLNVLAQGVGLQHYSQSDKLMDLKRRAVDSLRQENHYWGEDFDDFNPGEFNSYLDDLRIVVNDPGLRDRGDVKTVARYLALRQVIVAELERRDAAGGSASPVAKSNQTLMRKFRDMAGMLTESNLDFETYWYNGLLDRDPMLDEAFFKGDN